ncbi:MAG: hypothetical protein COA50_17045 [Flavobacteriaceae bacterium]|nr:MAG: hypothetical protein COA50_17045 [Flavobacteriaceae bacterium]
MTKIRINIILILALLALLNWGPQAALAGAPKTDKEQLYSVEQLLKTERLGNAVASPDGRYLALEKLKSLNEAGAYENFSLAHSIANRELWIIDIKSSKKVKVNIPGADSVWAGSWSPDGTQLVLNVFSLKDRTLKIGIWNLKKRHFTKLPGMPELSADITYPFWIPRHVWVDNRTIVYPVLPAGTKPDAIYSQRKQVNHIVESSQKTWKGKEASYDILDSGARLLHDEGKIGHLVRYNIRTNEKSILAKGNFANLYLSPDRKKLMVLTLGPIITPGKGKPYDFQPGGRSTLRNQNALLYFDLQNQEPPNSLTNKLDMVYASVLWSPNSKKVAFMARDVEGAWQDDTGVYIFDVENKNLIRQRADDIDINYRASTVFWLGEDVVVFRPQLSDRLVDHYRHGKDGAPSNLWKVSSDSAPLKVASKIKNPITHLCPQEDRLLAIAGGELWQLNSLKSFEKVTTDNSVALTGFDVDYLHFNKSSVSQCPVGDNALLPFVATKNGKPVHVYLDREQKTYKVVPGPLAKIHLSAISARNPLLLYKTKDQSGSHFTLITKKTNKPENIFSVNQHRQNIRTGEMQSFSYNVPGDQKNKTLTGWILTPPDYQPGRRYPVMAFVYPGRVFGQKMPDKTGSIDNTFYLNGQMFAARGYIVLYPSLPMDTMKRPLNLPEQLADMTNAALDQLIEQGIADPDRLAIMGHSDGGYTTLSILTQTDRFKTAIASGGIYNVTSKYGTFTNRDRRTSRAPHRMFAATLYEASRRFNASPWQAPERYIRNSPLFFADKITTPVMFIHGDVDFVPIQQAEEMFTALYRQRKKARFIRFWGEGHGVFSPANIRQVWREIDRWLDETMGAEDLTTAEQVEGRRDTP